MIYQPVEDSPDSLSSITMRAFNQVDMWLWESLDWTLCYTTPLFIFVGRVVYFDAHRIILYQGGDTYIEFQMVRNQVQAWYFGSAVAFAKYVPELLIGRQVTMRYIPEFGECTITGYDVDQGWYSVKPHDPRFCFGGEFEWSAFVHELVFSKEMKHGDWSNDFYPQDEDYFYPHDEDRQWADYDQYMRERDEEAAYEWQLSYEGEAAQAVDDNEALYQQDVTHWLLIETTDEVNRMGVQAVINLIDGCFGGMAQRHYPDMLATAIVTCGYGLVNGKIIKQQARMYEVSSTARIYHRYMELIKDLPGDPDIENG